MIRNPCERALALATIRETLAYLRLDNPRAEREWVPEILSRLEQRPIQPAEIGETRNPALIRASLPPSIAAKE